MKIESEGDEQELLKAGKIAEYALSQVARMFTRAQSKDEYEEINEWINVEIQRQQNIQMNELETIIRTQFDEHVDNNDEANDEGIRVFHYHRRLPLDLGRRTNN